MLIKKLQLNFYFRVALVRAAVIHGFPIIYK